MNEIITPYYYQKDGVDSIFTYFENNTGNPLIGMPTGTGKSVVIASFLQRALAAYPSTRVMIVTHVKELVEQNYKKLFNVWPTAPAGVYSAGLKRREHDMPITFAGIASVHKQPKLFGHVDLLVIDECHLVNDKGSTMYSRFITALKKKNPYLKVIGLSATCYRTKGGELTNGGIFDDTCYDLTSMDAFNNLVDEGYLSTLIPKPTYTSLDTSEVKITAGEFNNKSLADAVDKDELNRAIMDETIYYGKDRKRWLIFASSIAHVQHLVDILEEKGISAVGVHSQMKKGRDEILALSKQGKYQAIVNNNVLTTGYDDPEIDLIGMVRPTRSPGLWVQMLGRGTRVHPNKENCLVLDFAENTKSLGPINDPVLPKRRNSKGGGSAPIRICPQCYTYVHISKAECPYCKFIFPVNTKTSLKEEASTLDLVKRPKIEEPIINDFKVDHFTYAIHHKKDRPDSIKITYFCGLRQFRTYLGFDHGGYFKRTAISWWNEHSSIVPVPDSTEEAMGKLNLLMPPKKLKVWINKKHPEIISYLF